MPNYTYRCESCEEQFDVIQMMSDAPVTECPTCGESVKRIIGRNIGIQFKGSGFYVNDSVSKSSNES